MIIRRGGGQEAVGEVTFKPFYRTRIKFEDASGGEIIKIAEKYWTTFPVTIHLSAAPLGTSPLRLQRARFNRHSAGAFQTPGCERS